MAKSMTTTGIDVVIPDTEQQAMECPTCRTGILRHFQDAHQVRNVLTVFTASTSSNDSVETCGDMRLAEAAEIQLFGENYIGCSHCDFMGTADDVLSIIEQNREAAAPAPRYTAYEVDWQLSAGWVLSGILGDEDALTSELIAHFESEVLAFSMMYRISGIPGVPGQRHYPVSKVTIH